jgi:SAM-dependent MidA family methyltransferase
VNPSPGGEGSLLEEIASIIRQGGPITFEEYMALALYHPDKGYYAARAGRIGRRGDFITSPEVSPAFGGCIALQLIEMDRQLGSGPFTLVELGAGSGRLAGDILSGLAADPMTDLPSRLTLILVETSPALREESKTRLDGHGGARRILSAGSLDEAVERAGGAIGGAVISNELFDALPVRIVRRAGGQLLEKCVDVARDAEPGSGCRLVETLMPVEDTALLAYAERYGVAREEGTETEVGLQAARLVRQIATGLERGFHLAIDYGYEAEELYSPARSRGTLLAYWRHRTNEEVLERVGEQDLTAHVNFSALIDEGRAGGLETAGLTTQDRFLLAFDLADRIEKLAGATDPSSIRERLSLISLIHPEGMGRTFRMLFQYKGIPTPDLTGLRDPYAQRGQLETAVADPRPAGGGPTRGPGEARHGGGHGRRDTT